MMKNLLALAESLVRERFEGKTDRGGVPMAEHMARVVGNLAGEDDETLMVAWLHDIVEDTPTTLEELTELGFSDRVVEAVGLLTHCKKQMPYADYIDRICASGNRMAIHVKLADQLDNLDLKRWLYLDRYVAQALRRRYAGVQEKLLEAAIRL